MEKQLIKENKEQEVPMLEYNSAVQELVKIAKAEKANLDHQIVLAKSNLSQLRQEHIRLQGEFNQWKMGEEQKFRNDLSKRHNQLIDQENKMNILHKDLQQRVMDLHVKEERAMKVEEERTKNGNDRVEIEKMRVKAHTLMADADRKIGEADSIMAQANLRLDKAISIENKHNQKNQELAAREDKLNFDLKNLEMERNHLSELKEFVEPKIKEIKELEDGLALAKKEIEDKHQDIINKTDENKVALRALEDKKTKLDIQERELRSREDEFKRRVLIFESKK